MSADLSTLLIVALVAAGLIWAADSLFFKATRSASSNRGPAQEPKIVEYARSFFPVILVVVLLRSFLLEPFRIPSASMMPGLVDGDFIIVNKFAYGLRIPLFNTKIVPIGEPQRGDVVVFRLPSNPSVNYIKRLVGIPGDHVVVRDNRVFINGRQMPLTRNGVYSGGYGFTGAALGTERLGEAEHAVMFAVDRTATDFEAIVPADHYFFMGDNRNDSEDSRFPVVGFVPEQNLVGHAIRIWMNWRVPGWPDWRRIGLKIL
jgi:signal peptidase I